LTVAVRAAHVALAKTGPAFVASDAPRAAVLPVYASTGIQVVASSVAGAASAASARLAVGVGAAHAADAAARTALIGVGACRAVRYQSDTLSTGQVVLGCVARAARTAVASASGAVAVVTADGPSTNVGRALIRRGARVTIGPGRKALAITQVEVREAHTATAACASVAIAVPAADAACANARRTLPTA
jgi:hypothetical protein